MEYGELGRTSLKVSRLCFGALTIGPLQSRLPLEKGAAIILSALRAGVNFIDTAEMYGTYPYIKKALFDYECLEAGNNIVIASKSYAESYEKMKKSIDEARRELKRSYIDIFLMHEQSSRLTLKGHHGALKCLLDAKEAGIVKAVGISTHSIEAVRASSLIDEIDVIHPLLNIKGLGITDGSAEDMAKAVLEASSMGKGIYAMKALGGGHFSKMNVEAFNYLLQKPYITSVAVGMQSLEEVLFNTAIFSGKIADKKLLAGVLAQKRRLFVEGFCTGCGACLEKCPANALFIKKDKAAVRRDKCILCGYCAAVCPDFCLKVI
jgi:aryl-alcohol dehydrogenase-like predicted oxidoreductase